MLSAGNVTKTLVRRYDASGTEEAPPYLPFFLERYAQAYQAELDAFAHSIRTGDPCSPSFEDGVSGPGLGQRRRRVGDHLQNRRGRPASGRART